MRSQRLCPHPRRGQAQVDRGWPLFEIGQPKAGWPKLKRAPDSRNVSCVLAEEKMEDRSRSFVPSIIAAWARSVPPPRGRPLVLSRDRVRPGVRQAVLSPFPFVFSAASLAMIAGRLAIEPLPTSGSSASQRMSARNSLRGTVGPMRVMPLGTIRASAIEIGVIDEIGAVFEQLGGGLKVDNSAFGRRVTPHGVQNMRYVPKRRDDARRSRAPILLRIDHEAGFGIELGFGIGGQLDFLPGCRRS